MAAILGLSPADVTDICKKAANQEVVSPGNLNSPEQTVISGHAGAVKRGVEIASQCGAKRAVMLPVSAPFHSALMEPAQKRLEPDLRAAAFGPLRFPLITNADAEAISSGEEAREALIRQVTLPVRWHESDARNDRTRRARFSSRSAPAKCSPASCGRSTAPSAASTWKMPPASTPPSNASPRPAPNPRRISRRKQPRVFPCRASRDPGHSAQGLYAFFRAKQRETSSLRSLNVRTERKVTDSAVSTSRGRRRKSAGLRLLRRIR